MKTPILLRISGALTAIQGIAQGVMFLRAKATHGVPEIAIVQSMQTRHFDFSGSLRSYWDFYTGYGIEAAAICLVEGVLLVQLASIAKSNTRLVKPIVLLFAIANIAHAVLMSVYFFRLPLILDLVVAAMLVATYMAANMESQPTTQ